MNLEEVKQYLEVNKEQEDVKAYIEGLSQVTPDGVKTFLETDEGKKLLQPRMDSYFTKGLETWKGNNLQRLIDEEVAKLNPQETSEQKRIRELEAKIEKAELARTREALKNKALSTLSEKKLPTFLVDQLVGNDEESTNEKLSQFEEVWNTQKEEFFKNKVQSFGNSGTNPVKGDNQITQEEFNNMKYTERVRLKVSNPSLYERLAKN
ncbi:DUF4355 domain-containing protein [Oceanobacillus caeni]|uniref:DUF4355 domain-containing protein n=1 Tax=Oceanobacillus caeni TaxID=405946 RepID=UPI002149F499|nr:DUF4355 domain-containing protein [Oceanobacillus caeni]MCR1833140.1 DUF4355 domain-containing protein [Oceanobacillus caeni]